MTRDDIRFSTKRDFRAFSDLIKRSELGNKEPDVVTIRPVVNADGDVECEHSWQDEDWEWHDCENLADVRVVRNHAYDSDGIYDQGQPTKVYSDTFCIRCFQRELNEWLEEQLGEIADVVFEVRERGEFENDGRQVRTDGGLEISDGGDTSDVHRSPDAMFRNYDEAIDWVESADLQSQPVVLEDHCHGDHIATARVQGSHDRYKVRITNHEGADTTSEHVVDAVEAAEMMGGWRVAGRIQESNTPS